MNKRSDEKFANFLRAFGATRFLLQQAHEKDSLIEGVVLYAALVDGFCRICLILNEQIKNKSSKINEKYIYQNEDEQNFSERSIYKQTFQERLINKKIFDELNRLYDIRNKAIHRFFISEIEYSHMGIVCHWYEKLYSKLWKITYDLEKKQIKQKVGMTVLGKKVRRKDESDIYIDVAKKIKSGSERNLAKTLNYTSVEEVAEFASKNGLMRKCTCGHEKISHIDSKFLKKSKTADLNNGLAKCFIKDCDCQLYNQNKR